MLSKEICRKCYFEYGGDFGLSLFDDAWQYRSVCACFWARQWVPSLVRKTLYADDLPVASDPPEACPYMLEQLLENAGANVR
jgi:hypothetical protein